MKYHLLQIIVESEIADRSYTNKDSCTQGLLWLKRSIYS